MMEEIAKESRKAGMDVFFDTAEKQAAIARDALNWLGTPFMPYCQVKGRGVDCIRFVAAVLEEAGAIPPIDWKTFPRYTLDWSAHHSKPILEEAIEFLGLTYIRIEPTTPLQPGDVLAFAPGKVVYHLGIHVGQRSFVHAMQGPGVIRTTLSHPTLRRFFRYAMRPAVDNGTGPEGPTLGNGDDLSPSTFDLSPKQ